MGDICLVGGAIPEISPSCLPTHVLERTVGFVMLLINRAVSLGALQPSRHIIPPLLQNADHSSFVLSLTQDKTSIIYSFEWKVYIVGAAWVAQEVVVGCGWTGSNLPAAARLGRRPGGRRRKGKSAGGNKFAKERESLLKPWLNLSLTQVFNT